MERYTGVQCLPTEVSYTDKYLLAHVHVGVSGACVYRSLIWLETTRGKRRAVPVPAGNCKRSSCLHISANGEGGKAGRACYPRHLCELAKWKRNRLLSRCVSTPYTESHACCSSRSACVLGAHPAESLLSCSDLRPHGR